MDRRVQEPPSGLAEWGVAHVDRPCGTGLVVRQPGDQVPELCDADRPGTGQVTGPVEVDAFAEPETVELEMSHQRGRRDVQPHVAEVLGSCAHIPPKWCDTHATARVGRPRRSGRTDARCGH